MVNLKKAKNMAKAQRFSLMDNAMTKIGKKVKKYDISLEYFSDLEASAFRKRLVSLVAVSVELES